MRHKYHHIIRDVVFRATHAINLLVENNKTWKVSYTIDIIHTTYVSIYVWAYVCIFLDNSLCQHFLLLRCLLPLIEGVFSIHWEFNDWFVKCSNFFNNYPVSVVMMMVITLQFHVYHASCQQYCKVYANYAFLIFVVIFCSLPPINIIRNFQPSKKCCGD